ncbi:RICIN domain-containing protein [Streptomyces sp. UG1]|uniref:RICIN domain-containing protein n=1 Tax=Streptomyces sp. UG1 TaxID=3417652 RepID=UPI003CE920C1
MPSERSFSRITPRLVQVDGGNVSIYGDHNVPQQHWALTPTGDGYYYLTNRFSGLSLNVDAGSTADGANINQFTYDRAPEKQWQIIAL